MSAVDASTVAAMTLDHIERAWNQADGEAFGDVFTDDSDFVDIRGGHHSGAAEVGLGHQALFDSVFAGSTIRYRLEMAREVAPGCVVMVACSTLDAPSGPFRGINRARMTAVLSDGGDRWSITAFHNTLVTETT
ncbi:MAG: hypothetical protein JWN99_533 [Ilumatobacteraceae bacterium]|nr:hypothetical protein [Ilumatobacteraceae bacterium]